MIIERNGENIELTKDEIYKAYKEHLHEMCVSDVESYIDHYSDNDFDRSNYIDGQI